MKQLEEIIEKADLPKSSEHEQFLTFMLDGEEYGLEILAVKELRGWDEPTFMPDSPSYVKGVINLRGDIIPIVDLRKKFHIEEKEYTHETVVLVVQMKIDNRMRVAGLVVDAVSDVYNIAKSGIKEVPKQGTKVDTKYLRNLALHADKIIIILNIEELVRDLEK